jgi:hypothetical protein
MVFIGNFPCHVAMVMRMGYAHQRVAPDPGADDILVDLVARSDILIEVHGV